MQIFNVYFTILFMAQNAHGDVNAYVWLSRCINISPAEIRSTYWSNHPCGRDCERCWKLKLNSILSCVMLALKSVLCTHPWCRLHKHLQSAWLRYIRGRKLGAHGCAIQEGEVGIVNLCEAKSIIVGSDYKGLLRCSGTQNNSWNLLRNQIHEIYIQLSYS